MTSKSGTPAAPVERYGSQAVKLRTSPYVAAPALITASPIIGDLDAAVEPVLRPQGLHPRSPNVRLVGQLSVMLTATSRGDQHRTRDKMF
jgi:hypothetical protein